MLDRMGRVLGRRARRGRLRARWARFDGRNGARASDGFRVEPTWLELTRPAVVVRDLPAGFAGFRIVQLSDFHCSRRVTSTYLAEAVDLALAQRPDLIVLTGDFVH